MKYLQLLSQKYRNRDEVISELLNINYLLNLPKGTEFFFSDIHGEHQAFLHLLRSASGVIKNKIDLLFDDELNEYERQTLAHLIYYPTSQMSCHDFDDKWYEKTIQQLMKLAKFCSQKYTYTQIQKKMPLKYRSIMMEMLFHQNENNAYIDSYKLMEMVKEPGDVQSFIKALCHFIREICIDWIHIIGDIYDRGPHPDLIIEELMKYDQVDIQWGNHDISWMGAACGNMALIANVIRISLNYNHFDLLQDSYGINLRALSTFAKEVYGNDHCEAFFPYLLDKNQYDRVDPYLAAKMHKAITVIQLKLEGQLISKHPEYHMDHLLWLKNVDDQKQKVQFLGNWYDLKKEPLPTVSFDDPFALTEGEQDLMKTLQSSFQHSIKLHQHIQFLYQCGNMYKKVNGNLLFHGCIPIDQKGNLRKVDINGKQLYGHLLMDELETIARNAYFMHDQDCIDRMWYIWCSQDSPVFGKNKLCLFEKYFIEDKNLQQEILDPYYEWIEDEQKVIELLHHFGFDASNHIINGHVPVKCKDGESPVKANGQLIVIDGGISKAYHSKTGIAGYTLIFDSQHLQIATHRPYHIRAKEGLLCLSPTVEIIETQSRIQNKDCDIGNLLMTQKNDLFKLLKAYRKGNIQENFIYFPGNMLDE